MLSANGSVSSTFRQTLIRSSQGDFQVERDPKPEEEMRVKSSDGRDLG